MNKPPMVSVILPAYNCEGTIVRAIESVVNQDFLDWELIAIDDGSLDGTWRLLEIMALRDSRIRVYRNEVNMGISVTLNRAFYYSLGRYIARMDGDDYARPSRLRLQVAYLEGNRGVAVVGAAVNLISPHGHGSRLLKMPCGSDELIASVYKKVPFVHPVVMFRRGFFERVGGYDPACIRCEDYDFWIRGSVNYKYANLPDVLLDYTEPGSLPILRHVIVQSRVSLSNGIRQGRLMAAIFAEVRRWISWAILARLRSL